MICAKPKAYGLGGGTQLTGEVHSWSNRQEHGTDTPSELVLLAAFF